MKRIRARDGGWEFRPGLGGVGWYLRVQKKGEEKTTIIIIIIN